MAKSAAAATAAAVETRASEGSSSAPNTTDGATESRELDPTWEETQLLGSVLELLSDENEVDGLRAAATEGQWRRNALVLEVLRRSLQLAMAAKPGFWSGASWATCSNATVADAGGYIAQAFGDLDAGAAEPSVTRRVLAALDGLLADEATPRRLSEWLASDGPTTRRKTRSRPSMPRGFFRHSSAGWCPACSCGT